MEREDFAACPLCKQYSHSIGDDQITEAFNRFQSMFSHRGDGIPTQYCFDEQTRDAAQVLMAAATRPTADLGEDGELVAAIQRHIAEAETHPPGGSRELVPERTIRAVLNARALLSRSGDD